MDFESHSVASNYENQKKKPKVNRSLATHPNNPKEPNFPKFPRFKPRQNPVKPAQKKVRGSFLLLDFNSPQMTTQKLPAINHQSKQSKMMKIPPFTLNGKSHPQQLPKLEVSKKAKPSPALSLPKEKSSLSDKDKTSKKTQNKNNNSAKKRKKN